MAKTFSLGLCLAWIVSLTHDHCTIPNLTLELGTDLRKGEIARNCMDQMVERKVNRSMIDGKMTRYSWFAAELHSFQHRHDRPSDHRQKKNQWLGDGGTQHPACARL